METPRRPQNQPPVPPTQPMPSQPNPVARVDTPPARVQQDPAHPTDYVLPAQSVQQATVPVPGAQSPVPVMDPSGRVPTPFVTTHTLVARLDEAVAITARHHDQSVDLREEINALRARILAPGQFSPEEMQQLDHDAALLFDKAKLLDEVVPTPVRLVTLDDIQKVVNEAIAVSHRLHVGTEQCLLDIQGVKDRMERVVKPTSQLDLDNLYTAILTTISRIETQAGVQGV